MRSSVVTKTRFREAFEVGGLREQWVHIYEGNGFWSDWARHRYERVLREILRCRMNRAGTALDIGIGAGQLLRALAGLGFTAIGLDFSLNILRDCRSGRLAKAENGIPALFAGDIEALPFAEEAMDLVTCLGVLEYLKADRAALTEIYRVLKPGGYLILVVASYHRFGGLWRLALNKVRSKAGERKQPLNGDDLGRRIRLVKPQDLRRAALEAGFDVERFGSFGGKVLGSYRRIGFKVPGLIYIGDHCMVVARKPNR